MLTVDTDPPLSPSSRPPARVLTGFTPSGPLHLGALLAVIEPMRALSLTTESLVFVSDLHALTLQRGRPGEAVAPSQLARCRHEVAALLIACGLDDSAIFLQSAVPEIPLLHYLLESTATYGEVARMVQFKEKSNQQGSVGVRLSLLSYPVLMAADILAHGVSAVPVGADQLQHLELTRALARRFNATYGETFVVPGPVNAAPVGRVMDLADPTRKMSKSDESQRGVLRLLDPPDEIRRKVARAVTDAETTVRHEPAGRPGVSNLLGLLGALTGADPDALAGDLSSYADLKRDLIDAVIARLEPIQRRYAELVRGRSGVEHRLTEGATRARTLAGPRVAAARAAVGLP